MAVSTTGSATWFCVFSSTESSATRARQVSAVLLIAVVVVIVVLDVIADDYEVSPTILVPLLLAAAGQLSVDLPDLRR